MTKKPNFFIIGAPKCGTTSLAEYLRSHPDVYFCNPKEPEHFNTDKIRSDHLSNEQYLNKYFSRVTTERAIGEGSTHYLVSSVAVKNILAFNPDAKFIVMLRNPVNMAESLYYEERAQLVEHAPTFEQAWKENNYYKKMCSVGTQIERIFAVVPNHSNILIISFNTFIKKPASIYTQVLQFLDIPHDSKTVFDNINPRREPRFLWLEKLLVSINESPLRKISAMIKSFLGINHWPLVGAIHHRLNSFNLKLATPKKLDPTFLHELTTFFEPEVTLVEKLTGINLYENL
jgi:hypothetical protein